LNEFRNSVNIVTRIRLDDRRFGVSFPAGAEIFVFITPSRPILIWKLRHLFVTFRFMKLFSFFQCEKNIAWRSTLSSEQHFQLPS
jgi:hypothetical protein